MFVFLDSFHEVIFTATSGFDFFVVARAEINKCSRRREGRNWMRNSGVDSIATLGVLSPRL